MKKFILLLTALIGAVILLNGVFMLYDPKAWFETVPGVTRTGFFNQHFIRDIGVLQLFIGCAFIGGVFLPERRLQLWLPSTAWLCCHAIFHFVEVAVGICAPSFLITDFPAVTLPALIGIAATWMAVADKHSHASATPAPERPVVST